MTGILATLFERRAVIAIGGAEAEAFLNGLVTVETTHLAPGAMRHGALLTPQGKLLFDFFITRSGDGFLLDTPKASAADFLKRLTFYRLRAKVDLDLRDDHAVAALWGDGAETVAGAVADPRLAALGYRLIGPRAAIEAALDDAGVERTDEAAYDAHRIARGVPEAETDFAYGEIFPHDAGLDQLHGVDFDKGCYVGQEVVSRMQHRGTARKRFVMVRASDGPDLPAPGTDVTAGGKTAGTLGSTAGRDGLALLRLDRIADAVAAGAPVETGGTGLEVTAPDWAAFAIAPESAAS